MPMIVIRTSATKVVVGFLLETTVESFDQDAQAAFTSGLRSVLSCHEPACVIDLVVSPGSVQVDAVLTVFEAEAESTRDPSLGDEPQGMTAYEQLTANIVAAARTLSSASEGATALELSSRLGVTVQSLPSVSVEELVVDVAVFAPLPPAAPPPTTPPSLQVADPSCYNIFVSDSKPWLINTAGTSYTGNISSGCEYFEAAPAQCDVERWVEIDPSDVCCVCGGGRQGVAPFRAPPPSTLLPSIYSPPPMIDDGSAISSEEDQLMSLLGPSLAGGLVLVLLCGAIALREHRRRKQTLRALSRYIEDRAAFEPEATKQGPMGDSMPILRVELDTGSTRLATGHNGVSSEYDASNSIRRMRSWPAEVTVRSDMLTTFSESSPYYVEPPSSMSSAPADQYAQLESRVLNAPANSATMARVHSAAIQRSRSIEPQTVALDWLRGEHRLATERSPGRLISLNETVEVTEVEVSLIDQYSSEEDVPSAPVADLAQSSGAEAEQQPVLYGGHQTRVLSAMRARSLNLSSRSPTCSVSPPLLAEVLQFPPLTSITSGEAFPPAAEAEPGPLAELVMPALLEDVLPVAELHT